LTGDVKELRGLQTGIDGFPAFMKNRAAAERLRQQMTVYIGEVHGEPTPGRLGTHPGAFVPAG
jgi:hypothetical protein